METVFAVFIAAIALVAGFALKGLKKSVRREIRRAFSPAPDAPPKNLVRPPRFDVRSSVGTLEQREVKGTAYVVDGDTIIIQKTQIRLFGIDAPEIDHPYGQKAKWALVSLCKGKSIRAEITDMDRHGRTVAKCYLPDGRDLSEEMVKMGMAIDWPRFSGGKYRIFETPDARKKLWLADARQNGHMHVWENFEARRKAGNRSD